VPNNQKMRDQEMLIDKRYCTLYRDQKILHLVIGLNLSIAIDVPKFDVLNFHLGDQETEPKLRDFLDSCQWKIILNTSQALVQILPEGVKRSILDSLKDLDTTTWWILKIIDFSQTTFCTISFHHIHISKLGFFPQFQIFRVTISIFRVP